MSEPVAPGPPQHAVEQRQTSWPDVIGIIGIIFGVLGILSELGNVLYPFGREIALRFTSQALPPGLFESIMGFMPPVAVMVMTGMVKLALAILLLVGAIYLKNRRRSGVQLLKVWAIIRIPWVVLEMGLAFIIVRRVFPALPHISIGLGPPIEAAVWFGMFIGMLVAISCSVFILIWFGIASIKAEVATWSD